MREPAASCLTCGGEVTASGQCLSCLLGIGLGETPGTDLRDEVFGDFQIACREDGTPWELGRGAMGVTYRATDLVLHRAVALKLIETPGGCAKTRQVRDRFLREARAAAGLRHPNVAEVFQFGTSMEMDRAFYAMELIDGETLEERVRRDGPLPMEAVLELAVQVARALEAAAAQGLVHRDLKPGNIMLSRERRPDAMRVTVIDFGLAKVVAGTADPMRATHDGFIGTPVFASPEQLDGAAADARSDIFSLGVTLWFALSGEVPFAGRSIDEIRHSQSAPTLPMGELTARKVPGPITALLRRILATDPAGRPASAHALLKELEDCGRTIKGRARRRWWAVCLAGVGIAGGAVLWLHPQVHPSPATAHADNRATANPAAYEAYVRGLAVLSHDADSPAVQKEALAAFTEAVRLDPKFALAWARLSITHSALCWEHESPADHGVEAGRALETATKLAPDLGEVFLARGYFHYHVGNRLAEAAEDFTQATVRLPNQAEAFDALGLVQRRLGRWDEALANFAAAVRTDPLSVPYLASLNTTYSLLGRYADARAVIDRELAILPGDPRLLAFKARTYQFEGNLASAGRLLEPLPLLPFGSTGRFVQIDQWFFERRHAELIAATRAALADPDVPPADRAALWADLGRAQKASGDPAWAAALREAKDGFTRRVAESSDDVESVAMRSLVEAQLGENTAAIEDGVRATRMRASDPMRHSSVHLILAQTHAQLGDARMATAELKPLLGTPGSQVSAGLLRIDPIWGPVRTDAGFASLAAGH